jgi:hypothetical protein
MDMRSVHFGLTFWLALALSGCGDGTVSSPPAGPSGSSSGGTTATPTPAPTPTPLPTVSPSVRTCSLPSQPNCSADNGPYEFGCCTERNIGSPDDGFEPAIDEAQRYVRDSRPELFTPSGLVKPGSEKLYTVAVAKRVTEQTGICAAAPSYVPEDEITLKDRQDKGQIFDIIQGDGTPSRRYATVCLPALF